MIFVELFLVFFLIGLFTIGGGYAMLPMIVDQVVGKGWLTLEAITNFVAIAESTPGPFAVNTATLVGFNLGLENYGVFGALFGAVFTTFGVILPSFIIILLIARQYKKFIAITWVKKAITGIKAIVVGLILAVVVQLIMTNVITQDSNAKVDIYAVIIIVIIFGINFKFKKLSPIYLIIISGILGLAFYHFLPMLF
ncbi:MAG TPA: chromate transporter [Acholeplasmataceae bacterium]|nr:chromate transporter [Acholeplasmataceae bacterium]